MALRNLLKRKKGPKKEKGPEITEQAPTTKKPTRKKIKKKLPKTAYKVLKCPHITEKATELAEKTQYVFKVFPRANKIEIKKAIKEIYNVDVLSVRIVNIPRKSRTLGKIKGWKKGYKKAIIKVMPGQKINIFPK